jgi:hypothetical protein
VESGDVLTGWREYGTYRQQDEDKGQPGPGRVKAGVHILLWRFLATAVVLFRQQHPMSAFVPMTTRCVTFDASNVMLPATEVVSGSVASSTSCWDRPSIIILVASMNPRCSGRGTCTKKARCDH